MITTDLKQNQYFLGVKRALHDSLPLTEYYREEFEKFTTFLTSKKCQNWPVLG